MKANANLIVIVGATVLVAIAALFVRLAVAGKDASGLVNYLTVIVPLLIPMISSVFKSHDAQQTAQKTADTATQIETNTNGKLDVRFAQVRSDLQTLSTTMDRHLTLHAEENK